MKPVDFRHSFARRFPRRQVVEIIVVVVPGNDLGMPAVGKPFEALGAAWPEFQLARCTLLGQPFPRTGEGSIDQVVFIHGIVIGIEHVRPDDDLGPGIDSWMIRTHRPTLSASSSPGVFFWSWQALHQLATRISSCDMKTVFGLSSSLTRFTDREGYRRPSDRSDSTSPVSHASGSDDTS